MRVEEHEENWQCENCKGEGVIKVDGKTYQDRVFEISCMNYQKLRFKDLLNLARGRAVCCPSCNGEGNGTYHWARLVQEK